LLEEKSQFFLYCHGKLFRKFVQFYLWLFGRDCPSIASIYSVFIWLQQLFQNFTATFPFKPKNPTIQWTLPFYNKVTVISVSKQKLTMKNDDTFLWISFYGVFQVWRECVIRFWPLAKRKEIYGWLKRIGID
jgi:hypothetical protein